MIAFKELLIASLKRYFRNKQAIFWGLVFPLVFITIFGLMDFGTVGEVNLGVADPVQSVETRQIVNAVKEVETLTLTLGSEDNLRNQVKEGEVDVLMTLPLDFSAQQNNNIELTYSQERAQEAGVAQTVLSGVIGEITFRQAQITPVYSLQTETIDAFNLDFVDFLVPGVVGFSIMQLSIFGVAFAFVDLKKRGVLRRLLVTPVNPLSFVFSEMVARLIMISVQIGLLFAVGIVAFGLNLVGSKLLILGISVLGALMFLFYGFAIAGYAEDQDQVPPIANIVTLPMMLLSGVFFPVEGLPQFLRTISDYLPLTFLVNALREVATRGAGLEAIRGDLLGMGVWALIGLVLAVKLFRWE